MINEALAHEVGLLAAKAVADSAQAQFDASHTFPEFGENVAKAYLAARRLIIADAPFADEPAIPAEVIS